MGGLTAAAVSEGNYRSAWQAWIETMLGGPATDEQLRICESTMRRAFPGRGDLAVVVENQEAHDARVALERVPGLCAAEREAVRRVVPLTSEFIKARAAEMAAAEAALASIQVTGNLAVTGAVTGFGVADAVAPVAVVAAPTKAGVFPAQALAYGSSRQPVGLVVWPA